MDTLLQKPKQEKQIFLNPLIKKLSKVNEKDENCASYRGIFDKCIYFIIMIFIGVAVSFIFKASGAMSVDANTGDIIVSDFVVISIIVALGVFAIFPFFAFLIRVTIPVTGGIYCASTGYILSLIMLLDDEMGAYILLALVLTVSIVAVMGFMFSKGYIKVTKKFRAVTSTLFFTMITGSLVMFICFFIPSLRDFVVVLQNNLLISVLAGVFGIVVATLFLLVDFDTIKQTVDNKLPKKYEWVAAFGMVFTIVWLYFKILDLLMKVKDAD